MKTDNLYFSHLDCRNEVSKLEQPDFSLSKGRFGRWIVVDNNDWIVGDRVWMKPSDTENAQDIQDVDLRGRHLMKICMWRANGNEGHSQLNKIRCI